MRGRRGGRAGVRVGTTRGAGVLLRPDGVRRALSRRPASRRGAGARRRPRQRDPPRRARLHDPASPPEARRGDAFAGGRRGAARANRRDRGRGRARRRLPQRRDDRRPALAGGRVLLPRDEHPHPGRAHGHRDGNRPRPDPRAGADRRRRAALAAPGGRTTRRARARVPDQRGGSVQRLPAEPGADHELPGARWPGRARRLRRGRRLGDPWPLRPAGREADRPRRRPRARAPADAPRARRVRDRRHHDAARLSPGAARALVFRRGRDVSRRRRVRGAGRACAELSR